MKGTHHSDNIDVFSGYKHLVQACHVIFFEYTRSLKAPHEEINKTMNGEITPGVKLSTSSMMMNVMGNGYNVPGC